MTLFYHCRCRFVHLGKDAEDAASKSLFLNSIGAQSNNDTALSARNVIALEPPNFAIQKIIEGALGNGRKPTPKREVCIPEITTKADDLI